MTDWHEEALCTQSDPAIFFPEKGISAAPAKAVCAVCPVATLCLREALDSEEPVYGVWGGLAEREIRDLRRQRGVGKVGHATSWRTHCRRDHEFTEANTAYRANGARTCRACARDKSAARRAKKAAA